MIVCVNTYRVKPGMLAALIEELCSSLLRSLAQASPLSALAP